MSPSASAADHRIQRARALIAEYDVPSARAILEAVAAGPPGAAWAAARVELVALGYGGGEYLAMRALLAPVLAEPSIGGIERALAQYWTAVVSEGLDEPVDLHALGEAIVVLEADEPYRAASARLQRGRLARLEGHLARAVTDFAVAMGLDECVGSMTGAAGARLSLAEIAAAGGDVARAGYELDAGLAWLARFPLGGMSVRVLEKKLRARRDALVGHAATENVSTAAAVRDEDPRLQHARRCLREGAVQQARALLGALAAEAPGVAWAAARLELAAVAHRDGDIASMRAWLTPILAAPSLGGALHAAAAYGAALTSASCGDAFDPSALEAAIALEVSAPELAADARMLRARWWRRHGNLVRARIDVSAAVGLYECAGSIAGLATARLALAEAAVAQGGAPRADYELRAGLAWLARFPSEPTACQHEAILREHLAGLPAG